MSKEKQNVVPEPGLYDARLGPAGMNERARPNGPPTPQKAPTPPKPADPEERADRDQAPRPPRSDDAPERGAERHEPHIRISR